VIGNNEDSGLLFEDGTGKHAQPLQAMMMMMEMM
jgi:hypothetical protein